MSASTKRAILIRNGKIVSEPMFVSGVESAYLVLSQIYPTEKWSINYITQDPPPKNDSPESMVVDTLLYKIRIASVSTNNAATLIFVKFDVVPDKNTIFHLRDIGFKWSGGKKSYWSRSVEGLNDKDLRGILSGAVEREK